MSSVVCHVEKFKKNDVKGIEIHNNRNEKYELKNKKIDAARKDENYDLIPCENYSKRIEEIIKENYTGIKKICSTGKKSATVVTGILISSDNDFFKNLNIENQRNFFEKSLEFLQKKYPHIVSATIHNDEHTPHMHVMVVPLTADGRLSAKDEFNRNNLKFLQEKLPEYLKNAGFNINRGVEGSKNKHLSEIEYKIKQEKLRLNELLSVKKQMQKDIIDLKMSKSQVLSGLKDEEELIKERKNQVSKEFEELKKLETQRKQALERLTKLDEEIENREKNKEKISQLNDEILTLVENIEKTHQNALKSFSEKINSNMHTKFVYDVLQAKYGPKNDIIINEMRRRRFRPEMIRNVMRHDPNFNQKTLEISPDKNISVKR